MTSTTTSTTATAPIAGAAGTTAANQILGIANGLVSAIGLNSSNPADILGQVQTVVSSAKTTLAGIGTNISNKNFTAVGTQVTQLDTLLSNSTLTSADVKSAAGTITTLVVALTKLASDIATGNVAGLTVDSASVFQDAQAMIPVLKSAGAAFKSYYTNHLKPLLKTLEADFAAAHKAAQGDVQKMEAWVEANVMHQTTTAGATPSATAGSTPAAAATTTAATHSAHKSVATTVKADVQKVENWVGTHILHKASATGSAPAVVLDTAHAAPAADVTPAAAPTVATAVTATVATTTVKVPAGHTHSSHTHKTHTADKTAAADSAHASTPAPVVTPEAAPAAVVAPVVTPVVPVVTPEVAPVVTPVAPVVAHEAAPELVTAVVTPAHD